jgi:hypothetical protein
MYFVRIFFLLVIVTLIASPVLAQKTILGVTPLGKHHHVVHPRSLKQSHVAAPNCSPNPNSLGPPNFVNGCPLPAEGLNLTAPSALLPQAISCSDGNAITSYSNGSFGCGFVLPQQVSSLTLSNNSIIGSQPSGTIVGTVSVTLAPSSPAFSGTLSLSGTDAGRFQLIGNNLEILGALPVPGTYLINIVATGDVRIFNSPFTQAETIQAQNISSISLSNTVFTGGQPSGFLVGNISVLMSAPSPAFAGNLSLSGADAAKFQILAGQLLTNGVVSNGTYAINIDATQGGTTVSQPVSLSAIPQTIESVSLLNDSFVGGTSAANNRVGVVQVTLSPALPLFSGTISLSGTDAVSFVTSGGIVNVGSFDVAPGSYSVNVVATQIGAIGSPFTSPQTLTGLTATVIQDPGPSQQLYDRPYYQCVRNFFVDPMGSDGNSGTSPFAPWLTIANADTSARARGDCINVAPGTYPTFNIGLKFGGSTAANNGYVAYRCSAPGFISGNGSGCLVTGANPIAAGYFRSGVFPNYLVFDGFNLVNPIATQSSDSGIGCSGPGSFGQSQSVSQGCHHWMIVNNIIENHGQSGVTMGDTEFTYVSHNVVSQNAHQGCVGFFGSGISYVVSKPVSGYSRTADDNNSTDNQALNWMGLQGASFPFSELVAWNDINNNYQGCQGGSGATDGNGIIIDTNNITSCNSNQVDYPNSTLVAFNATYNNGGAGVHVFASANVTVANNSSYQNLIDPTQIAFVRPGIDVQCGASLSGFGANTDKIENNISVAIPDNLGCGGNNMGSQNPFNVGGGGIYIDANYNSPGKNVTFAIGTSCNTNPGTGISQFQVPPNLLWDCAANKCFTDPLWVDVGKTTTGSEAVPPNGKNFSLTGTSPAIGTGATESYLPAQSVDVGACSSTLGTCP